MAPVLDPFDEVLELETRFYDEGFQLGAEDGGSAGLIEGRFFGLEKGFEKYLTIGDLNGRATFWGSQSAPSNRHQDIKASGRDLEGSNEMQSKPDSHSEVTPVSTTSIASSKTDRLASHVRSLYALTEPASLSTHNDEQSVADFDDRLRRAQGKIKVIEKLGGKAYVLGSESDSTQIPTPGEGSIEDASSLHMRH